MKHNAEMAYWGIGGNPPRIINLGTRQMSD